MTRAMIIQATKVVLMELVITKTSLEIIKNIALRNRGINNQNLMELVINTTSLYFQKKQSDEKANITEEKEVGEVFLTALNRENDTSLLHANKRMTGDTFTKNTWIGDTGVSCHMTNLDDGMFETTDINEQVKVGNSTKITATKIVKWCGVIEHKYTTKKNIVLDKVILVPELWTNLSVSDTYWKNNEIYQTTGLLYHCQRITSSSRLINYF